MQLQFARTTLLMAGLFAAPVMAEEFEEDKKRKYQAAAATAAVGAAKDKIGSGVGAGTVDGDSEAPPADWNKGLELTSF